MVFLDLKDLPIWDRLKNQALEIFTKSLNDLNLERPSQISELLLNRKLLNYVQRNQHKLRRAGVTFEWTIISEAKNQPDLEVEILEERERKVPDFTCHCHDYTEEDHKKAFVCLTIECKRLGTPLNKRVFNNLYVKEGLLRFVNESHGYGKNTETSIMIGYIQSMDHDSILKEVNETLLEVGVSVIPYPIETWAIGGVSSLSQVVPIREFKPYPFTIIHLWADFSIKS